MIVILAALLLSATPVATPQMCSVRESRLNPIRCGCLKDEAHLYKACKHAENFTGQHMGCEGKYQRAKSQCLSSQDK
jgi:hypothetical protein